MCVNNGTLGDVFDDHFGTSIERSCDGKITSEYDNHHLIVLSGLRGRTVQKIASIALVCDHTNRDMSENIIFAILKVVDFSQARDQEYFDFVIVVVVNVFDQES